MSYKYSPFLRAFTDNLCIECRKLLQVYRTLIFLLIVAKTVAFFRVVPWGKLQGELCQMFFYFFVSRRFAITEAEEI